MRRFVRALRRSGRWLAAVAAIAFWIMCYQYVTLPDVRTLRDGNPATTAFMQLRAAEAQADGDPVRQDQRWVSYNHISEQLKRAVLVAEDDAFWQHEGVDFEQLQKSMEMNWQEGKFARGGSTITQQLAKNLYLSPSRNPLRKLREFFIARRLEAELSKRRILELYLNVIEWGDGIWGAEAASRDYFRKPAGALSAPEAALLAGAIINPRVQSPAHPDARLRARQKLILARMRYVAPPPPAPELVPLPAVEPVPTDPGAVIPMAPEPPRKLPGTPS
jgi:monofunctional glycosyltransferase